MIVSSIFSGCNQHSEQSESQKKETTSIITYQEVENQNRLEERTLNFFDWYQSNSEEWHRKSSEVVGTKDNFYFLDTLKLELYISWLNQSNYFSKSYLLSEEQEWRSQCNSELLEMKNSGVEADGPPPCVYEADILFLSQDPNIQELVDNISLSVDTISIMYAIIDYGISKLNWENENGIWKISSLH